MYGDEMKMGGRVRRLDADTRQAIVDAYMSSESMTYAEVGRKFGVAYQTVCNIVKKHNEAGKGIIPDRRPHKQEPESLADIIKPLVSRKRELEERVTRKQAELEKARQDLRDYTATIKKLFEENV